MGCKDDCWPRAWQVGYGVGYYIERMMFEINPRSAIKFIKAIKLGKSGHERSLKILA